MNRRRFLGFVGLGVGAVVAAPVILTTKAAAGRYKSLVGRPHVAINDECPRITAETLVYLNGQLLCPGGPGRDYTVLPNNKLWFDFPVCDRDYIGIVDMRTNTQFFCQADEIAG